MATKSLGLTQTKGAAQFKGIVVGTQKDGFFTEKLDKNKKSFRQVKFGVQISKDEVVYFHLNGGIKEAVYFYKKADAKAPKGTKGTTKKVDWKNRNTFNEDGYKMIGVNLGLEKVSDDEGKEVNDKHTMDPFDACEYIRDHLKDGDSVFIKANLDHSHYLTNSQELRRATKFVPTQISLCKPVDFDDSEYKYERAFKQTVVTSSVEKQTDGRFAFSAKIVNYGTIEDVEFIIENPQLAKNLRSLGAYVGIEVWGDVKVIRNTEEVESTSKDDGWGSADPMQRLSNPYTRELIVTGANKDSVDKEAYTEKVIDAALESVKEEENSKKEFETGDWGEAGKDVEVPW